MGTHAENEIKLEHYWIDTKWACGLIIVDSRDKIVIGGAPIFKKFIGQNISQLSKHYCVKTLKGVSNED